MQRFIFVLVCALNSPLLLAQSPDSTHATAQKPLSVNLEVGLVDLISGGFNLGFNVNAGRRWSVGIGLASTSITGTAKELVFRSENPDALDLDLPFVVGINARLFAQPNHRGLYGQVSVGNEIFRIRSGSDVQTNPNNFGVISVGYLWRLSRKADAGFYINPRVGANFTWNSGGEYRINTVTYELRPLFINPGLFVGWQF